MAAPAEYSNIKSPKSRSRPLPGFRRVKMGASKFLDHHFWSSVRGRVARERRGSGMTRGQRTVRRAGRRHRKAMDGQFLAGWGKFPCLRMGHYPYSSCRAVFLDKVEKIFTRKISISPVFLRSFASIIIGCYSTFFEQFLRNCQFRYDFLREFSFLPWRYFFLKPWHEICSPLEIWWNWFNCALKYKPFN